MRRAVTMFLMVCCVGVLFTGAFLAWQGDGIIQREFVLTGNIMLFGCLSLVSFFEYQREKEFHIMREAERQLNVELEETADKLRQEQRMYRDAMLFGCDYAYTVNVSQNKVTEVYNEELLNKFGFNPEESYDEAMSRVVKNMKPVILHGKKEFHLTSHYMEAYEKGVHVVEVEYYIRELDLYKRKTIFLSMDEASRELYVFVVAHDVTALRKEEEETKNAMKHLASIAAEMGRGNLDVKIDTDAPNEVGVLAKVLNQTKEQLQEYIAQINKSALTDALTGAGNKRAWIKETERINESMEEGTIRYAVVVCDVNELKRTNDQYGHEIGDDLIIRAARYISETFEKSEVFRIGGDEFAVILENEELQLCKKQVELFAKNMAAEQEKTKGTYPLSIAIGISYYIPETDKEFADVFQRADYAMYQNKASMKQAM